MTDFSVLFELEYFFPQITWREKLFLFLILLKIFSLLAREVTEAHSHTYDELVGLAIFSERVPNTKKAKIIDSFMEEPGDRKVIDHPPGWDDYLSATSPKSELENLLPRLSINLSFLSIHPEKWSENQGYEEGKSEWRGYALWIILLSEALSFLKSLTVC